MNYRASLYVLGVVVVLSAFIAGTVRVHGQSNYVAATPTVSVDELRSAGFTDPAVQAPTASRFKPPVLYFHVKETVGNAQERTAWGDAANLVAVLVRPMSDRLWKYNNGQMEVKNISGRVQVNLSSPGYFISVTGPDQNKVATLAHNLSVLY